MPDSHSGGTTLRAPDSPDPASEKPRNASCPGTTSSAADRFEQSSADPGGWTGKILHVDLTTRTFRTERPPLDVYRRFLGGRGMTGHILRPRMTLPWDHPDMPVAICAGPLTGTDTPGANRTVAASRSPLTGALTDAALGGSFGIRLKQAGWDGVVVTGRADTPCGLVIEDGEARLADASALAGQSTTRVFDALLAPEYRAAEEDSAVSSRDDGAQAFHLTIGAREAGTSGTDAHLANDQKPESARGCSAVVIGPAAKHTAFANLVVDRHHSAGRGGIGRCFGSKNLHYITVSGSGEVAVRDPEGLSEAREAILRLAAASPVLMGGHGFANFGTGALFDLMDARRMMPTDNFSKTRFADAATCNAPTCKILYHPDDIECPTCPVHCGKLARNGPFAGTRLPEFEGLSHFTALIGNPDPELAIRANAACADLGLDPVSAAATLACHREIVGETFTPDRVLELLEATAHGSDELGRALAQGSLAYARSRGREEASMSAKGLELPPCDPRGAYGMSLAYALSTRGGCHLRANPLGHEILRKPVATNRFTYGGKARIIKLDEDLAGAVDSMGVCRFLLLAAGPEEYAKALTAVTGIPFSGQDLLRIGERTAYGERLMIAAVGFTANEDDLPQRFFTEPGNGDETAPLPPLDREAFLDARARYYRIRGLDENALPTDFKTRELELA